MARKHEAPISQIAKDFGIAEATLPAHPVHRCQETRLTRKAGPPYTMTTSSGTSPLRYQTNCGSRTSLSTGAMRVAIVTRIEKTSTGNAASGAPDG